MHEPFVIGPPDMTRKMITIDERIVRAPVDRIFRIVRDVEHWPAYLSHYRNVRFRSRATDGGGVVEMSANRPFGPLNWPTWWLSEMSVSDSVPFIRFRHIGGITKRMDVEWSFSPVAEGTHVRLYHVWNGPSWPVIGEFAATNVIGPVFIHGIASRTLEGLARVAENTAGPDATSRSGISRPPSSSAHTQSGLSE